MYAVDMEVTHPRHTGLDLYKYMKTQSLTKYEQNRMAKISKTLQRFGNFSGEDYGFLLRHFRKYKQIEQETS